jgi:hypothetical protein
MFDGVKVKVKVKVKVRLGHGWGTGEFSSAGFFLSLSLRFFHKNRYPVVFLLPLVLFSLFFFKFLDKFLPSNCRLWLNSSSLFYSIFHIEFAPPTNDPSSRIGIVSYFHPHLPPSHFSISLSRLFGFSFSPLPRSHPTPAHTHHIPTIYLL